MVVDAYRLFASGQLSSNLMHPSTNLALVNVGFQPIKEARVVTKKRPTIPKYRSISAIRDFPPISRRFNPYLSDERKRAMHAHLTQILDEYARMELEEFQLLKTGALPKGSDHQMIAFLSNINKDYEVLVKGEEDSSEE
jgi:hypothetical protein